MNSDKKITNDGTVLDAVRESEFAAAKLHWQSQLNTRTMRDIARLAAKIQSKTIIIQAQGVLTTEPIKAQAFNPTKKPTIPGKVSLPRLGAKELVKGLRPSNRLMIAVPDKDQAYIDALKYFGIAHDNETCDSPPSALISMSQFQSAIDAANASGLIVVMADRQPIKKPPRSTVVRCIPWEVQGTELHTWHNNSDLTEIAESMNRSTHADPDIYLAAAPSYFSE